MIVPCTLLGTEHVLNCTSSTTTAAVCCKGDAERAEWDLKRNLRDTVQFERNTVWRDMVAMERRSAAAHVAAAGEDKGRKGAPGWFARNSRYLSILLAGGARRAWFRRVLARSLASMLKRMSVPFSVAAAGRRPSIFSTAARPHTTVWRCLSKLLLLLSSRRRRLRHAAVA